MNKYHEMNEKFHKDLTKAIERSLKENKSSVSHDLRRSLKKM